MSRDELSTEMIRPQDNRIEEQFIRTRTAFRKRRELKSAILAAYLHKSDAWSVRMNYLLEDCLSSLQALLNPTRALDDTAIDRIVNVYLARSAGGTDQIRRELAEIFQAETRQSRRRDQIVSRIIQSDQRSVRAVPPHALQAATDVSTLP